MSDMKVLISTNILPVEIKDIPSIMKGDKGDKGTDGRDGSFVQKAYKTYASMVADKGNIPTNTSVLVNNDPDKDKNAYYTYDGTEFTKSDFDPQGILTTVDVRLNQAVESASDYFQRQVADTIATSIDNSTIAYDQAIEVTKGQWANTISTTDADIRANSAAFLATIPGTVNDAINNTAVEGGVLADTFITVTANGVGTVPRTQRDKNAEIISFEDFGAKGDGVTDDTLAIAKAIASNAKFLHGRDGATYIVKDLVIARELTIQGKFTIAKPIISDVMIKIMTGDYAVTFNGITFDGKYAGGGAVGATDIQVESMADGLVINFIECQHNNVSKHAISTGYLGYGKVKLIHSMRSSGNGNHAHRAFSQETGLYHVNYTELILDDYKEVGDGIFEGGADITRMPMLQVAATECKITINRPQLSNAGGFSLYKSCDNAVLNEPNIDNTGYPFRVQQSKNATVNFGSITNTPLTDGAILFAPYTRIGTALSRSENGLKGLDINGTVFEGNIVDIGAQGAHLASGGSHGVIDCRARGIRIKAVFRGAKSVNLMMQDADFDASGSDFTLSETQTRVCQHNQTAVNGAMGAVFDKCNFDGTVPTAAAKNCVVITHNIANTAQIDTRLVVSKSRMHNMRCVGAPQIYLRGAATVDITDNKFTGVKPEYLVILRDHNHVKFWGNTGLTYPLSEGNSSVNLGGGAPETIKQIESDAERVGFGRSVLFEGVNMASHYENGSVILLKEADVDGFTAKIKTSTGWLRTNKAEV